jgi:EmrB/QacA subfamily drug resistance transporter
MLPNRETHRGLVIASVMAAMFMAAIEATIVATAMPQIVGQIGGLRLYSWVFSSFLLTQTASTVVFGKLSDIYGRKPVVIAGIAVFLAGSILCGLAWSMPALIVFRLVQGFGAGAIQPVSLTIVGDLYPAAQRGKVQGFIASVWAVSAVLGPTAGALIIEHLSWAWVFWINLPIGCLATLGFVLFLREDVRRERRPVDLGGAILFTAAVAGLMITLTELGGTGEGAPAGAAAWPWALLCLASTLWFFWHERRVLDPMIELSLWGRRPIAAANGAGLFAGMALVGLTTFLPIYVQGVLGRSPVVAGLALTMTVLGWPIGATWSARSIPRFGLRPLLVSGALLMPVGASAFLALGPESSPILAAAGSLVMGFGMGLVSTCSIVLVQEIVAWAQRGSATASHIFARNLGSTLGATALGAVLNYGLARSEVGRAVSSEELRALLQGGAGAAAGAARATLEHALHLTFWAVFAISLAVVGLALLVPAVALGRPREAAAKPVAEEKVSS